MTTRRMACLSTTPAQPPGDRHQHRECSCQPGPEPGAACRPRGELLVLQCEQCLLLLLQLVQLRNAGSQVHEFRIVRRLRLAGARSEEHTSELQSLMRNSYAVFCLKKKNKKLIFNHIL